MSNAKIAYETAVTAAAAAKDALTAYESTMPMIVEMGSPEQKRWAYLADEHLRANAEMNKALKAWTKERNFRQFTVDEARSAFGEVGLGL